MTSARGFNPEAIPAVSHFAAVLAGIDCEIALVGYFFPITAFNRRASGSCNRAVWPRR
jgi:hypothetical protein